MADKSKPTLRGHGMNIPKGGANPEQLSMHQGGEYFPHEKSEQREKSIQSKDILSCK